MPDELVKKQESVWKRLTRLFRSGPVVRHKIKTQFYEPQGTARAYKKELSQLYVNSLASYGQYERLARYSDYSEMEFCVIGDTKIAVSDGYKTIKELADEYGLDKTFIVYSYDHSKCRIVPAIGKQARKTRTDHAWKVTFDNGKEIIGTADHRLMLRNGQYKMIKDLKKGDSMMPFYRRSFYSPEGRLDPNHYQYMYDGKCWQAEHRIIAEHFHRHIEKGEVVHHINFLKHDNRPENLKIMTDFDHKSYHSTVVNGKKWDHEKNSEWIEKFKKDHSKFMKNNNPASRNDIKFSHILQVAEKNNFNLYKTCDRLNASIPLINRRLNKNGFKNWTQFAKAYNVNWKNNGWDNKGSKNPKWDNSLTFQDICNAHEDGISGLSLAKKLNTTPSKIKGRVKQYGFKSAADFCASYQNCKVKSVEYYGFVDLYDLTVDGYKNFATDSVISHNTPEIASALDIYSDETTAVDEKNHMLDISSSDSHIKSILETLFYDIINIEFNLWSWVRNLCKYGDFVLFVDASETNGILNLLPIPINEIEREEGYNKDDPFAVRFRWITQGNMILENWQVIHFRLLGNDNFLPYGSSIIEAARRIWRQLILIEDAMLVYRVIRSPERRVFYVDVGNIPPNDIDTYMEQVKTSLKRNQMVNSTTGRVDLRYNPLSVDEDYFIPIRGEKSSRIETLPGGQFTGDIEDVQYIQSKLFSALKIPKAYLGYEENLGSKATLAQEDVRFSRTISRVQKIVVSELNKIAIIHLFLLGFDGEDLTNFEIKLSNPSIIAMQQKLELWRTKFEVAGTAQEGMLDKTTVYKEIFGFSDEEISKIKDGRKLDKLEELELESVALPEEAGAETEAGAELAGEEELPNELGGPPGMETAEDERETPVSEEGLDRSIDEKRNDRSKGDRAEISVSKGKDLFSTGEDQSKLVFGTKQQAASDPYDKEYLNRLISRPLSDSKDKEVDFVKEIDEQISDILNKLKNL